MHMLCFISDKHGITARRNKMLRSRISTTYCSPYLLEDLDPPDVSAQPFGLFFSLYRMGLPPCLKRIRDVERNTVNFQSSAGNTTLIEETSAYTNSNRMSPCTGEEGSSIPSPSAPMQQSRSSSTVSKEESSGNSISRNDFTSKSMESMATEQLRLENGPRNDGIYQTTRAALISIQHCGEFQCEVCITRPMGLECGEPWLGIETMDHRGKRTLRYKSLSHRGLDTIEFTSREVYPECPGVNLLQILKRDDIIPGGADPLTKIGPDGTERRVQIHYGDCKRIINLSCTHAQITLYGLVFLVATVVYRELAGANVQDPTVDSVERIRSSRLLGVCRTTLGIWTAEVAFVV
ncbi:hypothetical protein ARMGADRAFT_177601 [Armillaria gallica]|uniref:Uncharacterized protein n=1 Tax=Armillaria gallica TaxID=47427 RepID=A0A2H3DKV2_ARMGA|nr:hypothetical protein ARMGADRAFT_177601 [Armillaria gallica]